MSYRTMATMARDNNLLDRVAACAATQHDLDPLRWAAERAWQLAAQPGWDAAYEYALAAGNENPGGDNSVVSDGMILAAVQALRQQPQEPTD